ncbi:hypothetical protein SDJN02_22598, partial [Cucurbita argyrosperma subsp. argyrosperma]
MTRSSDILSPLCLAVKSAFTKFTKTLEIGSMRPLVIMARRSLVSRSSGALEEAYVTFTVFTPLPPATNWTASLPNFSASSTNASSALTRASSSITPPRATFTILTPFFIFAKFSSLRIFDVAGVKGICKEMKSAVPMASSKLTSSTPIARARSAGAYGSCAITCMPSPFARRATSVPTLPNPITAIKSAIPCSAAATVFAVGAFTTKQPCSVAAARSTLSMPTPALPTTFNLPPEDSNTSRLTLVPLRTIIASQSEILVQSSSGLRLYEQSTLAKSFRRSRPASPSFSATRTVGFASIDAETNTTNRGAPTLRRRRSTEKAEGTGILEDREESTEFSSAGLRSVNEAEVAISRRNEKTTG